MIHTLHDVFMNKIFHYTSLSRALYCSGSSPRGDDVGVHRIPNASLTTPQSCRTATRIVGSSLIACVNEILTSPCTSSCIFAVKPDLLLQILKRGMCHRILELDRLYRYCRYPDTRTAYRGTISIAFYWIMPVKVTARQWKVVCRIQIISGDLQFYTKPASTHEGVYQSVG